MKKRISVLILIVILALTLASCEAHFGSYRFDMPWWSIALISVVVITAGLIIGGVAVSKQEFVCPKCGEKFSPKWYQAAFGIHCIDERVFRCPRCGHKGFCKKSKE